MNKETNIKKERENVGRTQRMLDLLTVYICTACILSLVPFYIIKVDIRLWVSIFILLIGAPLVWLYAHKTQKYDFVAILLCYMMNIIMLPMLYLFGGGLYGGMPMLFVAGYVINFVLLKGLQLYIAVVASSLWYVFILVYSGYYIEQTSYIFEDYRIVVDFFICFFCGVFISILVLSLYANINKLIRNSIEISQKSIEATGAEKSRFLANMSHELRTPMNAILGMAELLEREQNNADVLTEIGLIKESALSLLNTINNVLTYSKLDSKKYELIMQHFELSKLLSDVIYNVNMEIGSKNIEIFTVIDPHIPNLLYGDESRIREVFQYILFNAVRDTDDGRISMEVGYRTNEIRNNIILTVRVSDTGLGLTQDEMQSIFTSFEIYDSRRYSKLKRLGLELTICRDILELMRGNLSIESINGVGSSVYFEFEVYNTEDTPIVAIDKNNSARVLILSTRESRQQVWGKLLADFGILPDFVGTPVAFEARIKEKKYDLIFIEQQQYQNARSILERYDCERKTYVATDYNHVFGDFGQCRILRKPISCLNLTEAIENSWRASEYMEADAEDTFVAPQAKILLVDDNMVNLKVGMGLLQKYGINASVASSGIEAIDKCEKEEFDIVFLDHMMAPMDGIETLNHIRELSNEYYSRVPIISMTATIGNEVREDMIKSGFQEYLAKPIKIRALENILRSFLPEYKIKLKKKEKSENTASADEKNSFAPGLSAEAGIERMGGSMEAYADVLNTYYSEGEQKIIDIMQEHDSADWNLFVINVHAVKGSSASIGGLEVSELFRQLEMAGKNSDFNFIEDHLDVAIEKYRSLLDEIKAYLEEKGMLSCAEENILEAEEEEFPMDTMLAMQRYLVDFDITSCEQVVEGWNGHNYGEEINNFISGIRKAIENFDYDRAGEFVQEFVEVFSE